MNPDIYRTVKDRILYLEYRPGQILNENALAREFGVSRTPVREVLTRLEWEQLARVIPRTGTMVAEIEFQKIMNAYQARREIDGLVARLAAKHAAGHHIERLDRLQERCLASGNFRNLQEMVGLDLDLREILHDAAGNPVLTEIAQYLYDTTLRLWVVVLAKGGWADEAASIADETGKLKGLFRSRDGAGAEEVRQGCLMHHIERIRTRFLGTAGPSAL